jgi:hypothetical protein
MIKEAVLWGDRFGQAREPIGSNLLFASRPGSFITETEVIIDDNFAAMSI